MAKFGIDSFGGWVLKCDPYSVWDLASFLADGHSRLSGWSVQDNKRSQAMRKGQPVAFWVSGKHPSCPTGLWSMGNVSGPPRQDAPDQYWLGPGADLYVPIDLKVKDVAVPRAVVAADPVLARSELILVGQMGNPVMLTTTEWGALEHLYKSASARP